MAKHCDHLRIGTLGLPAFARTCYLVKKNLHIIDRHGCYHCPGHREKLLCTPKLQVRKSVQFTPILHQGLSVSFGVVGSLGRKIMRAWIIFLSYFLAGISKIGLRSLQFTECFGLIVT